MIRPDQVKVARGEEGGRGGQKVREGMADAPSTSLVQREKEEKRWQSSRKE